MSYRFLLDFMSLYTSSVSISRRRLSASVYKSSHRGPYFFFQLVVEKIVHQDFAVVKDRHPAVDRFVQKQLAFCACRSRPGCLKI